MAGEESDGTEESLLFPQVVIKHKKLMSSIRACVGNSRKKIQFQLDTGASCNILNYSDYCDLGKPALDGKKLKLCQFDESVTRDVGGCTENVADKTLHSLVHKMCNHSLLSIEASLELGLISPKEEWVNLVSDEHIDNILGRHGNVLKGIGCLPGEYQIEVDKAAVPKQCHNRKTPLSKMNNIKARFIHPERYHCSS